MSVLYVTMEEVQARLGFDMDAPTTRLAQAAIAVGSDMIAEFKAWTVENLPRSARRILLNAIVRYLRNPDGYNLSVAADERVGWQERDDIKPGELSFTEDEIKTLSRLSNRQSGIRSIQVYAFDSADTALSDTVYVPVLGASDKPFPWANAGGWYA